ncbi:hypothetical protein E2C01_066327 [Portunus trituberculatus]|uniref:Uncharacterized protein n=1 Tax=Portunus trituberculatus TaxID=210409 RepID=A0A5B7HUD1_PORTR|nr:hypothetical protein [Portunus trituberculatus]
MGSSSRTRCWVSRDSVNPGQKTPVAALRHLVLTATKTTANQHSNTTTHNTDEQHFILLSLFSHGRPTQDGGVVRSWTSPTNCSSLTTKADEASSCALMPGKPLSVSH